MTAKILRESNQRFCRRLLVLGLCALSAAVFPAWAQLSPGPLSAAHASLDSPTKCTSCHSFGVGAPQFKCLECHQEIQTRMAAKRGYHARAVDVSEPRRDCVRCHAEHYGREFKIVRWPASRDEFDHRETGYPLEGKHARLSCEQCHNAAHVSVDELRTFQVKDPGRTFLGLSTACVTCHKDEHHGQLGIDCARCHGLEAWKDAAGFDHSRSRFPLTGRHESVACEQCHPKVGTPKPHTRYTGRGLNGCNDCHQDPHLGAFVGNCDSCHSTRDWRGRMLSSGFDHSATSFPLVGRHQEVACNRCHGSVKFKEPVAHTRCTDCHKPDPHGGQFRQRADRGECAPCHDEKGFKPSLFLAKDHQQTDYPLTGKHLEVACDKCHLPAGAKTIYRLKHSACRDCHEDAHGGQFAGPPYLDRCDGCHTVDGFHPSSFTESDHGKTRFPLDGSHQAVACIECHKTPAGQAQVYATRFKFPLLSCPVCHEDPHQRQFEAQVDASKGAPAPFRCESCHNKRSWREIGTFDHSVTLFPLEGAHRIVSCTGCHRPSHPDRSIRGVQFRDAAPACASCHDDVHAGQFDLEGKAADCASCHTTRNWQPTRFDHEKYSTFSLAGAHETVSCGQCHETTREVAGRRVTLFKDTPRECEACHSEQVLRRSFPAR